MAKRGVKVKDTEKLDSATISKVARLLTQDKPITKKEACEILNINYNTTRLKRIIEQHEDEVASRKKRFANNRKIPIDSKEVGRIILGYLQGDTQQDLVEYFARSPSVIKRVIDSHDVPERPKGDDKHVTSILPDQCVSDIFEVDEIVWSAKYHRSAIVTKCRGLDKSGSFNIYQIYVLEPSEARSTAGFYHDTASYDIGSLKHLQKYLNVEKLT